MDGYCGPCGHPWDWHGKREDGRNDGACEGSYDGLPPIPCNCRRKPPFRKLHAAGAGNSGYTSFSEDYKDILATSVENFYIVREIREACANTTNTDSDDALFVHVNDILAIIERGGRRP